MRAGGRAGRRRRPPRVARHGDLLRQPATTKGIVCVCARVCVACVCVVTKGGLPDACVWLCVEWSHTQPRLQSASRSPLPPGGDISDRDFFRALEKICPDSIVGAAGTSRTRACSAR